MHAEKVGQDGGGQIGRQGGGGAAAGDSNVDVVSAEPGGQGRLRDVTEGENLMGVDQRGVDGVRAAIEGG